MAIEKLKRYKSQGSDHIPGDLIQARGRAVCSEIHKHISSPWNKKELPQLWKESIIVPVHTKGHKRL
jgi:hypothetical protein